MLLIAKLSTHCGGVTHACLSKLTTIGQNNDLSSGRRQAIIWTNVVRLVSLTIIVMCQ